MMTGNAEEKRTDTWLASRMYLLWENHFADVPRRNLVLIKFGRSSSRQLGSIKWANRQTRIKSLMKKASVKDLHAIQDDERITVITITRKFVQPSVPGYVVDATIAHELVHYAHGFSSPLQQTYTYPHQGGIVRKELASRGLDNLHRKARTWLKENWQTFS